MSDLSIVGREAKLDDQGKLIVDAKNKSVFEERLRLTSKLDTDVECDRVAQEIIRAFGLQPLPPLPGWRK